MDRRPFLCHPERSRGICSVRGPFVETRNLDLPQNCHLDRSGEICGFSSPPRYSEAGFIETVCL
jgi:hypothetical protein